MVDWASKSYEELEVLYWNQIAPERREEGHDPKNDMPSHEWLNDHGYSGIHRALKRDHDTTTGEFFDELLDPREEFDWAGSHHETQQWLEKFLTSLEERKNRADSTIQSKRGRLSRILRTHLKVNNSGDLISSVRSRNKNKDAFEQLLNVGDELDETLESTQSKFNHIYDLIEFYQFLLRRKVAAYNPGEWVKEEFDWDCSGTYDKSNPCLSKEQVKKIWDTTRDLEEQLIVICYVGLGLRTDEPASLTRENFDLEKEGCPRIDFDERKNYAGTVPVLVGKNQIAQRLREVQSNVNKSDCLFPSTYSDNEALSGAAMRDRFKDICRRAGVKVDGETPTPRHARRTWYSLYTESLDELYGKLEFPADDQSSKTIEVVRDSYLNEDIEFQHHRGCMKPVLREIMPGVNEYGSDISFPSVDESGQAVITKFG